jgi:glycosyltransferase involved in cell wall biosynthesis
MRVSLLQTPAIPLDVDRHGGLERVALSELDYLAKGGINARLFVAHLIGPKKKNLFEIKDLGWQNRFLKFYYYIRFGWLNRHVDIFHGHYTPILALLFPKKSVIHFHGLAIKELILYRYKFARKRYLMCHYVFCARWVKDEFREIYPDIPENRLHVVYNGIDVEAIAPRSAKGIGRVVKICFYSRWVEKKGIYDVLEAAEILEKKGRKDFVIWYAGWTDSEAVERKIREWAAHLKVVRIVGLIKPSELPAFLRDMDLGLVPSTYSDPFPLVPLEMMAAGLPVAAYGVGGLKESIIEGQTGLLAGEQNPGKLAEMIEFFLDNRSEIERMGRAARKHVEGNFTWEKHIQNLISIYDGIHRNG